MLKNIFKPLMIMAIYVLSQSAWAAGMVYKCKNPQGALVYQKSPCKNDEDTVDSWKPKEAAKPLISESESEKTKAEKNDPTPILKLKQNIGGHYATDGNIDGKALSFVVDTGASYVSLPEKVAHEALIYCDNKINMDTANGVADACTAKIKKLQFGPFYVENVAAVIVPNLSEPLLGMNVLQLFKVAQEKGEMHISMQDKTHSETK